MRIFVFLSRAESANQGWKRARLPTRTQTASLSPSRTAKRTISRRRAGRRQHPGESCPAKSSAAPEKIRSRSATGNEARKLDANTRPRYETEYETPIRDPDTRPSTRRQYETRYETQYDTPETTRWIRPAGKPPLDTTRGNAPPETRPPTRKRLPAARVRLHGPPPEPRRVG